jgi:hypothetical protein
MDRGRCHCRLHCRSLHLCGTNHNSLSNLDFFIYTGILLLLYWQIYICSESHTLFHRLYESIAFLVFSLLRFHGSSVSWTNSPPSHRMMCVPASPQPPPSLASASPTNSP